MFSDILNGVGGFAGVVWVCLWIKRIGIPLYLPALKNLWEGLTRRG